MVEEDLRLFLSRVRLNRRTGCWVWVGGTNHSGYGMIWDLRAHRVAYEHWVDDIPSGKVLHHTCGVKRCVNPRHLKVVTRADHHWEHHREEVVDMAASPLVDHERRFLVSVQWVAQYYGVDQQQIYHAIRKRKLIARRLGGWRLVLDVRDLPPVLPIRPYRKNRSERRGVRGGVPREEWIT
jgi:HNH endonuclease